MNINFKATPENINTLRQAFELFINSLDANDELELVYTRGEDRVESDRSGDRYELNNTSSILVTRNGGSRNRNLVPFTISPNAKL